MVDCKVNCVIMVTTKETAMMEVFDQVVKIVAGFAAAVLTCNFVEIDWQLAIMSMRDASEGRWVPEFNITVDIERLTRFARGA